ncbi:MULTISPECIES: phosphoribosylanthranilate isomerase [Oligella]|uniref:N-(5'-phosphoribosyl)anthranilate isomerase n=2 Tax=Oligella urethralis TaxID=90245 RepID=A0A096BB37_9BURK|nr:MULTISPECIES: phosphoribosylanthranilate isomerase [Oligella]AVL71296.1 phosphoribosylanthranilate isomerase [Oligella urethralis]KGF30369.1 N-(5'-phosphoribosyl)anthranilate isomerase [Oligella urethralis DNF00040]MDK6201854.1 phosphoribosylanthranilate isomerase [Oligella urethralis]PMC18848.1 phosphoribosylanthranilate isomerase [Oligella urethralis]WOS37953.1 N-(5'-phosphoribosyl)anthranilate isomerase [Oligella urethralis]
MSYRTRIKFCGMTHPDDIQQAVDLGVDALGFILYPKSKRALSFEQLKLLVAKVPVWVSSVVLLVNPEVDEVRRVITEIKPDYLQFHGDESAEFCEQFNYPYLRAIRVGAPGISTPEEIAHVTAQYQQAKAFIFDAYSQGYGGAGISFDADLLNVVREQQAKDKIIIAGGLHPQNIRSFVQKYQPFAVDLCSGVESSPGHKDPVKMQRFMSELALGQARLRV